MANLFDREENSDGHAAAASIIRRTNNRRTLRSAGLASDGSPPRRYLIDTWSFFSQTKEIIENGYHACCVLQLRAHSSSHLRDAAFPCRQSLSALEELPPHAGGAFAAHGAAPGFVAAAYSDLIISHRSPSRARALGGPTAFRRSPLQAESRNVHDEGLACPTCGRWNAQFVTSVR